MKVAIGEVVNYGRREFAVKTKDGIFCLGDDLGLRIGQHILVRYVPEDQFAYLVSLDLVLDLLIHNDEMEAEIEHLKDTAD